MTKNAALYEILNFGRSEEHEFLKQGKTVEAYQIENARNRMHYALLTSIKALKFEFWCMTTKPGAGASDENILHYVTDDFTRALVKQLAEKF